MENKKFAIYSRKSKFTGKGESIGNQIEMCRQYIKMHHEDVTDDDIFTYEDEGYSGKNTDRPQFKQMMKDGQGHKFNTIVCYRFDRVSRNIADFSKLIQELENLNISFIAIKENFDTTSPMGRAMMFISSVFSQLERETIAERIRDNMEGLAKQGRWLGGTTPTGYKSVQISSDESSNGKSKVQYKLEIIDEEADIVKMIFSKFLELNSLTKVESELRTRGIKTKTGVDFQRFGIRAILTNPVYMIADENAFNYFDEAGVEIHSEQQKFNGKHGVMVYNKTIQTTGKTNQIRNMDEWIVAVGKHKGLINGADWVKVQKMIMQNKSKSYRKPRSNVALLSGLLFCKCGDYMRPKLSQRKNKDGELIYDYLCQTKEKTKSQNCNNKRVNGNKLDKMICDKIKELTGDGSQLYAELEESKKIFNKTTEECENRIESLKNRKRENEKKISSLVTALANTDDSIPAYDYINTQINELHEENIGIENQIKEWEALAENNTVSDTNFDITLETLKSFSKSFDALTVEQKRQALKMCVNRVEWDGINAHLYIFCMPGKVDISNINNEENSEPLRRGRK